MRAMILHRYQDQISTVHGNAETVTHFKSKIANLQIER
jgi:hypothetical protein